MPVTALDVIVVLVILLSTFLAMVRGFSRELLSLASWGGAALASFFAYPHVLPFVENYLSNKIVALAVTLIGLFFVFLLVLSVITMKIADIIIDSRIGAIDRTFGLIFGIVRGVLIGAIAVLFVNALILPENRPAWLEQARTKPLLDGFAGHVRGFFSSDPERVMDRLERSRQETKERETGETGTNREDEASPATIRD